jgi:N-acetyl-gamma-glutamyl-phosphate reductase
MKQAAIVGGSGYTGLELMRLLAGHGGVEITALTSRQHQGQRVADVFPALAGRAGGLEDLSFEAPDPDRLAERAEYAFTAVPHRAAMEMVPGLLDRGLKVIDLSADFRFSDPEVYGQWYQPHQAPELLREAAYGLPELHRARIETSRLVGNPGCYPTSVILAAAPLLAAGLIDPDGIIADSKSGVSGAGRGLNLTSQFCEINDGLTAYKVVGHRHTPEMEQELGILAGRPLKISFTPHLVPMSRGILSTVYAPLAEGVGPDRVHTAATGFYRDAPMVRVVPRGAQPHTLDVRGTNFCDLGYFVDQRVGRVKAVAVIDNLTRGASGQAVANFNLMAGLPETTGLTGLGLRP